jgi:ribosomal protein S18 acetylase RimI-like enzyme
MIEIRELGAGDDLVAVLQLCREFSIEYQDHHHEFFDVDEVSDADISGKFRESLESNNSATIIAVSDEKIVGYASLALRRQPPFYRVKEVGSISALMVAKEYRRRGIATRILVAARAYFRQQGIKYYTFYTAVANRAAIRLYEKVGMAALHTSFIGEA